MSDQKTISIQSPCMNICTIDPDTGYCNGCYRTLDEISNWPGFSNHDKLRIVRELEQRRLGDAK